MTDLLDAELQLRSIAQLLIRGRDTDHVQVFRFERPPAPPPGHHFRLRLSLERDSDARAALLEERQLANARERLHSHLLRACSHSGYTSGEIDDLVAAFEGLVSARGARALRIHCDADHVDEG